jgi:hypothetical protein
MINKKPDHKIGKETLNYVASASRIERWQLCQKIGVLYYEAEISLDKLQQVYIYLQRSGVLTEENINDLKYI